VPQLSLKTVSVVLLGVFNVRSFTPTALLKSDVLTLSDAVSADAITILSTKVSSFEIEGLKVDAQSERIQVDASAPPYIRAADILNKTLRENSDFPSKITAIGVNVNAYYMLDNYEMRDRLGRKLAPIDAWGKWGEQLKKAQALPPDDPGHSGMMSIVMRLPMPDDRISGHIDVRVEPSSRLKSPEVFIAINDHYGISPDAGKASSSDPLALLEVLETRFDSSVQRAEEIMSSLLEQAK